VPPSAGSGAVDQQTPRSRSGRPSSSRTSACTTALVRVIASTDRVPAVGAASGGVVKETSAPQAVPSAFTAKGRTHQVVAGARPAQVTSYAPAPAPAEEDQVGVAGGRVVGHRHAARHDELAPVVGHGGRDGRLAVADGRDLSRRHRGQRDPGGRAATEMGDGAAADLEGHATEGADGPRGHGLHGDALAVRPVRPGRAIAHEAHGARPHLQPLAAGGAGAAGRLRRHRHREPVGPRRPVADPRRRPAPHLEALPAVLAGPAGRLRGHGDGEAVRPRGAGGAVADVGGGAGADLQPLTAVRAGPAGRLRGDAHRGAVRAVRTVHAVRARRAVAGVGCRAGPHLQPLAAVGAQAAGGLGGDSHRGANRAVRAGFHCHLLRHVDSPSVLRAFGVTGQVQVPVDEKRIALLREERAPDVLAEDAAVLVVGDVLVQAGEQVAAPGVAADPDDPYPAVRGLAPFEEDVHAIRRDLSHGRREREARQTPRQTMQGRAGGLDRHRAAFSRKEGSSQRRLAHP
jgi:hypothetical protein